MADAEMTVTEGRWLEAGRARVAERAAQAPHDADGFVRWFESLEGTGPGQNDPLFPWLAKSATMEEMRWFLTHEVAGRRGSRICAPSPRSACRSGRSRDGAQLLG